MLRTDCITVSRPNLISIKSTKNHNYHTVCHARLPRHKAPWLQRLGSTMLSFNWRGKPQENTNEQPSDHLAGGGVSDKNIVGPSSSPSSSRQVDKIYENQRWIGTWQPPVSILDIPSWTDPDGNEVALTHLTTATSGSIDPSTATSMTIPPTSIFTLITDSLDWEVVVTPSTDIEGWQYATVFKHLEYKRPGGRASQRFGDTCRRRAWRKRSGIDLSASDGISAVSLTTTRNEGVGSESSRNAAAAAAAAKARETEAKNKAIRGFITMVLDLLSRRKVWTLVPWDPSALFFLYRRHQEIYQQLQTQASQRQIFAADTPPLPSMIHPQSGNQSLANNGQMGTVTLLQDLLCAAMHSRAAYGFAMAAGHITSVTSYIKLQTVQPLTFNAVAGASIEANNEAVAALAGIAPEDILLSEWKNFPFRPCHYVAIDRVNRCVVISIRGTLEIGDLLSDLAAHPMEIELGGVDGWVHPGILSAASYIHCTTEAALKDAAKKCPGWPVLITGHSLGGGVAALLSMLLRDRGGAAQGLGSVYAITVGSAAVMSESLAAACEEYVISLVLGSDVIPHLSYASVEKLLVEASEASPVRRVAEGLKKKLDSVLNITTGSISGGNMSSNAVSGAAANAMNSDGSGLAQLLNVENTRGAEAQALPPPLVPIIDLSNTSSSTPTHDDQVTATNGAPLNAGVVPVVREEEISILNYSSFGSDTGLAATAMAQKQQQKQLKEQLKQEQQLFNDPELLFPPGRILWIFPADEDVSSFAENSTTNGEDVCIYDEEKIEQAWDNAWQQGRFATRGDGKRVVEEEQEIKQSDRGVNIEEAEAQVVASHAQAQNKHPIQEGEAEEQGKNTASEPLHKKSRQPSTVPVVVEADRSAFERLLLMPDSLNDHLPHRILEALQQL